jgi:hypothetical protein
MNARDAASASCARGGVDTVTKDLQIQGNWTRALRRLQRFSDRKSRLRQTLVVVHEVFFRTT